MRKAEITRETSETQIRLSLNIDGDGGGGIDTGVGFLDHMLTLFAAHGRFDINIECQGDTRVDGHHTVEDVGLCLGEAFNQALSDRRGIKRYGDVVMPMDEALVLCAVDFSGRGHLEFAVSPPTEKVGDMDTELIEEFFIAFTRKAGVTVHLRQLNGRNTHHIFEACFKALARALSAAAQIESGREDEIPSTKGVI
ncbi:MAG: imidazoleglycerol-phosphate dehydratase HisB [Oscillospiraceae bacterium]|nr:imidazoleglycerol-phosphate dehydratase HisB [Oscillospiraceae bacterium]